MFFDLKDTKGNKAGECTYRSRKEMVVSYVAVLFYVWENLNLTCDRDHAVEY